MKIDILTLFPEMFSAVFENSIIGRAQNNGIVEINTIQIRDFANNKHNRVDDYPYGGGDGMVMAAEPVFNAIQASSAELVCYLTPKGRPFDQNLAKVLSKQKHVAFLCGHYEGVDERVIEECVDLEISLGDFVLTGGEIPTMAVVDATVRLLDGVLSEEHVEDSFYNGLLEYPQYTRPEEWNILSLRDHLSSKQSSDFGEKDTGLLHPFGVRNDVRKVPEVLLSGNHKEIEKWRREKELEVTYERRPDLLRANRIGILGGSFNPVHEGHMDIARQAQELYNLDKVIFIPCSVQPFKKGQAMMEDEHRLACLQIAVNNMQDFEVSTMEIDRGGVSYTIDTVRELTRKSLDCHGSHCLPRNDVPQNEYFFIVGEDCEPERWKDYEEICKLATFVKLPRIIEASSTGIRDGKFDFVPKKVAKYMEKNRIIYKKIQF